MASIQSFLIVSTCFLYLVAAGLFSKAIAYFETNRVRFQGVSSAEADTSKWNQLVGADADEAGTGPGSYDIRQSVWHVNVSDLAIPKCASAHENSAVVRKLMVAVDGESSILSSAGRTAQRTDRSSRTTCTGWL